MTVASAAMLVVQAVGCEEDFGVTTPAQHGAGIDGNGGGNGAICSGAPMLTSNEAMARESDPDRPSSSDRLPSLASEREIRLNASDEFLERTKVMPGAPARPHAEAAERLRLLTSSTPQSFKTEQLALRPDLFVDAEAPAGAIDVAPSAEVARVPVGEHALFRQRAVDSYLTAMREGEVLRLSAPWSRRFLAFASVTIIGLISASFFVRIDQTGRGRGTLRVAGGVQAVACQTNGVVLELLARSGDVLASDAVLAKIDSTATKMALLEAERQIQRAEEDVAAFIAQRDKEQAQRVKLLQQRAGLLARRAQSQRATVERLRQRVSSVDRLAAEGLASGQERASAENELAAGQRSALELDEEISATQLQISNIEAEMTAELEKRRAVVKKAMDRREALGLQLQQTEVKTPRAGRLEALAVKVGDPVTVGMTIGRIIPEGAPREIVVFLPEADRAFLQEGSEVRVELDQLPAGEFGALTAKVVRIGADRATSAEITEALGDTKIEGPSYRVELALQNSEVVQRLDKLLRPGSLVTARFVLRRRRLATLLFEPLRRFID